MRCIGTVSAVL